MITIMNIKHGLTLSKKKLTFVLMQFGFSQIV